MERLVIGVPACNEGATVAELAVALEVGAAWLGEGIRSELVLAYQPGEDDTLQRWQSVGFRLANRVLHGPGGVSGKGHNVKRLIRYAREAEAHLLLVDADLRAYRPANVGRFVDVGRLTAGGMALPLWCRPRGEGNSTDFLACPLLFAAFRACVRQPLAGQMLLTSRMLDTVDVDSLPDDYGIDIALTMHALAQGLPVEQVVVPFPGHEAGSNSRQIMENVASVMLSILARQSVTERRDVSWPHRWWGTQNPPPPSSRRLRALLEEELLPVDQLRAIEALLDSPPEEVRDFWCDRLADAIRSARAGGAIAPLVAGLVTPFLVHAEYRRGTNVDLSGAEAYVADLCTRLAEAVS
ncbi:MAG: hypothetical protein ACRDYY_17875 [Acidimicrobiales bacterium]